MNKPVMCHVVAGYPTPEACLQLMLGMQAAGATAIEVQIPFSDPIADGETIMEANDVALDNAMTTALSFDLIEKARKKGLSLDVYVMSYAQKVRHFGLKEFCRQATSCQVKGLIIPDLPYDSVEFSDLKKTLGKKPPSIIPVLSPGMMKDRLRKILALQPSALYITSQQGITGNEYAPAGQLKPFVREVRKMSQAKIMIGFGISTKSDVKDALSMGDIAVVGSAIIKIIQAGTIDEAAAYVKSLVSA